MMMRRMLMLVCSVAVAGCNLSDPLDGLPDNNQNNNNENNSNDPNNSNNTTDMNGGDDMGDGGLTVTFSEVRINDQELPTSAPAQTDLAFEADVSIIGATSAVQILINVDDAEPSCFVDMVPGDAELDVIGTIAGSDEIETKELLFEVFQESDCNAAIAAATGEGDSLGEIEFTNPPALQVIAVTPATDDANVLVDAVIRVSFDAPLDAGSVTGRVQLSNAAGQVPATVNVMNDEIILTPSNDLTEFQTLYTVSVSAGITGSGRELETAFMSSFRTRMFVPDVFYAASDELHGVGAALGIDTANQCTIVPADDTAPAQRFRFVPRDNGWIGYNSAPIAAGRALDGGDGTMMAACAMRPLGATPAPAQIWLFTPSPSGGFWMQNTRFNDAQSLDATNVNIGAVPLMQPTTDVNRQRWRWRRLPN